MLVSILELICAPRQAPIWRKAARVICEELLAITDPAAALLDKRKMKRR
jgi:hypothetical protein